MEPIALRPLLAEGENARLEYRSRQYAFENATDDQRSELLKDILALANTWRHTDAFVLLGVEASEKPAKVTGIDGHLDEAAIQEFVNSLTNRPIQFEYGEFNLDGATIAAIRVPVQAWTRPLFVRQRFGRVLANTVYLRSGRATVIADPDEIHRMGFAARNEALPSFSLEFADLDRRSRLGHSLELRRRVLARLPDDRIPTLTESEALADIMVASATFDGELNAHYWRDMRDFVFFREALSNVGFAVANRSRSLALGVRAVLTLPREKGIFLLRNPPDRPARRDACAWLTPRLSAITGLPRDVDFDERDHEWQIDIDFGDIAPGANMWTRDELLIGSEDEREIELRGVIYGHNFEPIPVELKVICCPEQRPMTFDDLRAAEAEIA